MPITNQQVAGRTILRGSSWRRSGVETVAREWICDEFGFVASAYGFTDADAEELTTGGDVNEDGKAFSSVAVRSRRSPRPRSSSCAGGVTVRSVR